MHAKCFIVVISITYISQPEIGANKNMWSRPQIEQKCIKASRGNIFFPSHNIDIHDVEITVVEFINNPKDRDRMKQDGSPCYAGLSTEEYNGA